MLTDVQKKKTVPCDDIYPSYHRYPYYPKTEILQRIIRKYWHLIKNDPTIGTKFKKNLTGIARVSPKSNEKKFGTATANIFFGSQCFYRVSRGRGNKQYFIFGPMKIAHFVPIN
jgi:hypothetical protein